MRYEYSSTDKEKFSLHDCRATEVTLIKDQLIFLFPDGFYFDDYSKDWPNTGKAEVVFKIDSMRGITVYQFIESNGQTIRKELTPEHLIDKINEGEWELEFAYRYDGYEEILYTCWIWQKHKSWSCECEIWIGTKEKTIFRWNQPSAEND